MDEYELIKVCDKDFCPTCHSNVGLLAPEDMDPTQPSFYICWECKKVFHIGEGEVKSGDS